MQMKGNELLRLLKMSDAEFFQKYLDEDKTYVMFGPSFPAPVQEVIFGSIQKYLAGQCNREESLKEITNSWNTNIG